MCIKFFYSIFRQEFNGKAIVPYPQLGAEVESRRRYAILSLQLVLPATTGGGGIRGNSRLAAIESIGGLRALDERIALILLVSLDRFVNYSP